MLYIGLGANIGDREDAIRQAIRTLNERIGALVGCSSLYETRPVGFTSENLFLNAVAAFNTQLSPHELLRITQEVERELGRTTKSKDGIYADRPIDIDLLLMDNEVCNEPSLTLPHPHLAERRFVLEPLCELAPDLRHPTTGLSVKEMLAQLNTLNIESAEDADVPLLAALNRLLPQLSASAHPLTMEALSEMTASPYTYIYIGRDEEGEVQAMATLCLCTSPTGCKAWVEDVVVDSACRGRGYAKALIAHLQAESARLGAKSLNLTSRPERQAANKLYQHMGFKLRTTNVYCQLPK